MNEVQKERFTKQVKSVCKDAENAHYTLTARQNASESEQAYLLLADLCSTLVEIIDKLPCEE